MNLSYLSLSELFWMEFWPCDLCQKAKAIETFQSFLIIFHLQCDKPMLDVQKPYLINPPFLYTESWYGSYKEAEGENRRCLKKRGLCFP